MHLWKSDCYAKLSVDAEAGNVFVSLRVGLGQAVPEHLVKHHRGCGPARQQRSQRRAAERQSISETEKASKDASVEMMLKKPRKGNQECNRN